MHISCVNKISVCRVSTLPDKLVESFWHLHLNLCDISWALPSVVCKPCIVALVWFTSPLRLAKSTVIIVNISSDLKYILTLLRCLILQSNNDIFCSFTLATNIRHLISNISKALGITTVFTLVLNPSIFEFWLPILALSSAISLSAL